MSRTEEGSSGDEIDETVTCDVDYLSQAETVLVVSRIKSTTVDLEVGKSADRGGEE